MEDEKEEEAEVEKSSAEKKGAEKNANCSVVDMKDCIRRLHRIIDPVPKRVPLVVISTDNEVPLCIISNDLKILRASLNILSHPCAKTVEGKIHFRVFKRGDQLIFECQDTRQRAKIVTSW